MSIRGLPDERPRPSVANLIGKFEQRASKRQSSLGPGGSTISPIASPSQSRATSVISHNTGDSVAIEAKERREWPPKNFNPGSGVGATSDVPISTNTNANTNSSTSASAFSVADLRRSLENPGPVQSESARNPVVSPPPSDGQASLSASVESIAQAKQDPSDPPAISSDSAGSATVPEQVKSDPGTQAGRGKKDSAVTTGRAPGKLVASKSANANSVRGAAGTATTAKAATTPRSSMAHPKSSSSTPAKNTVPAMKPLTAQRTGNSAFSASHRAKTPTAPRASTSTSSSAKASPAVRSKTPIAARAKTPTASVPTSPPKLPSSGLYAPTKASLARARNADAPPPPKHEKKVSSSTLERLMKPTAASASKARETPVRTPRAPVKLAAKPAAAAAGRGAAPTRGKASTLKPRVGLAPARMRAEREKKEKEKEQAKEEAAKAATVSESTVSAAAATAEHVTSEDDSLEHEQPFLTSAAQEEEESLHHEEHSEHEQEQEHAEEHADADANEPPSDIESYDDAFASDEEGRGLQLHSARPSDSGEGVVVGGEEEASFTLSDAPELSTEDAVADNAEHEHVDERAAADTHDLDLEAEEHEPKHEKEQGQGQEQESEPEPEPELPALTPSHADDIATNGNGIATPTASAFQTEHKQNGNNVDVIVEVPQVPNTEFDSVLDMLSVKPPPSPAASVSIPATAGEIPDEDEEF